jgi:hypothetical protein
MNRAAWRNDPAATKELSSVSEVPETPRTSFVIVELATPPRQAFRFAEQVDARSDGSAPWWCCSPG